MTNGNDQNWNDWRCPGPDDVGGAVLLKNYFYKIFVLEALGPDAKWLARFAEQKLSEAGRKTWPPNVALQIAGEAEEKYIRKMEAEEAAEKSRGGRKPTPQSRRRDKIRDALGVGKSRAYDIEREGTINFNDRVKLAAAFAHDPNWNRPVHWEPKEKQRRPGPRTRDLTMRAYVLAQADAFECEPPLDKFAILYSDGALPDDFADLDAFLVAARGFGIGADSVFATWESFKQWRASMSVH